LVAAKFGSLGREVVDSKFRSSMEIKILDCWNQL
jgi:hypothetical protein